MGKVLVAALRLYDSGYIPIPFRPNEKAPSIEWKDLLDNPPDRKQTQELFDKRPDANLGIVCGDVVGLDIDDYGPAMEELDKYDFEGLKIPMVRTPSGGQHWYFANPGREIGTRAKVLPGIDVRGAGGVLACPPSVVEGRSYSYIRKLSPASELPPPPAPLVSALKNKQYINNNPYIENLSFIEGCHGFATEMFSQGQRNDSLFHVAHHLIRGRMPRNEVREVLYFIAINCNPPYPFEELEATIQSAIQRAERKEINLRAEVESYISVTDGAFSVTDVVKALQPVSSVTNRDNIRQIFRRLKADGVIEKAGPRDGVYRKVETECEDIDFLNASNEALDIKMPFGEEQYVKIMPGNVIVVAGAPNAGKTAYLLNLTEMNMEDHEIYYFSSEMGDSEFRERLEKFGRPLDSWKFKPKDKAGNFDQVIRPDAINIIDYLELHEDFWKVGGLIRDIHGKLGKGIAVIALQKNPGLNLGLGGVRSLEKARLYLSLDNHVCRIEKGKNWRIQGVNPNGLEVRFKIVQGCKFLITEDWKKGKQ